MSATYHLFSLASGGSEPNVGIWLLTRDVTGQPVRLQADLVEWKATPPISIGGAPTQLSPSPYPATHERNGVVYAINETDPDLNQIWYIIPNKVGETFIIAADPEGIRGWTAGEPGAPIKITDIQRGAPNQSFRFVPV